jgi:B9 domain-containing protein 1
VWNFPLQSSWKSTNPHGWPRLIVSLYGPDEFGNDDVAYGYGSTVLPICAGHFTRTLAIYRPQSQSLLHKWTSWFTGRRPELIDPKTIALNEGRDGNIFQEFRSVHNFETFHFPRTFSSSNGNTRLRHG